MTRGRLTTATTSRLSDDDVRRLRSRAQRLDAPLSASVGGVGRVVADVCGIQAQDRRAAALSVRARTQGLTLGDVEQAQLVDRSVVRTWAMRGTFHLVAAEDVGWLLALLGPIFVAAGRRRLHELGLDDDNSARAVRLIADALDRHETRTRAELADDLRRRGLGIEPGGRAIAHLVHRAALEGVLCVGPDHDGHEAYVRLDRWTNTGAAHDPEAALAELGRRYLSAYGPAGPHDLAAWSGLPLTQARRAWSMLDAERTEVLVAGEPCSVLSAQGAAPPDRAGPVVRLLPAFDTFLLGYRSRALHLDDRHLRRVWPGGGWIHPTVVVDGRVVATWRLRGRGRRAELVVEPFDRLQRTVALALEADAADVGRFLGTSPSLVVGPTGR